MRKKGEEGWDTAALVTHGMYQYVRLPKELRFEGDRVQVRKFRNGVILKPLRANQAKPTKQSRSKQL